MNRKFLLPLLTVIVLACNAVTATTAPSSNQPSKCANLTSEECANNGIHEYMMSGAETETGTNGDVCSFENDTKTINKIVTITIRYSDNHVYFDEDNSDCVHEKSGENTYSYNCPVQTGEAPREQVGTKVFNINGFVSDDQIIYQSGGTCFFHTEYIFK